MTSTETSDSPPVAACGLYCGECGAFKKKRCPGCAANAKATWCAVRRCCLDAKRDTCAECPDHPDPRRCAKFNHWIARAIGWLLNSDRARCIARIREVGRDAYAKEMAETNRCTLPRTGRGPE